jgi:hypothetical protein
VFQKLLGCLVIGLATIGTLKAASCWKSATGTSSVSIDFDKDPPEVNYSATIDVDCTSTGDEGCNYCVVFEHYKRLPNGSWQFIVADTGVDDFIECGSITPASDGGVDGPDSPRTWTGGGMYKVEVSIKQGLCEGTGTSTVLDQDQYSYPEPDPPGDGG